MLKPQACRKARGPHLNTDTLPLLASMARKLFGPKPKATHSSARRMDLCVISRCVLPSALSTATSSRQAGEGKARGRRLKQGWSTQAEHGQLLATPVIHWGQVNSTGRGQAGAQRRRAQTQMSRLKHAAKHAEALAFPHITSLCEDLLDRPDAIDLKVSRLLPPGVEGL